MFRIEMLEMQLEIINQASLSALRNHKEAIEGLLESETETLVMFNQLMDALIASKVIKSAKNKKTEKPTKKTKNK